MNAVNRRIPKLDARALTTGKGVYSDDLIPPGALTVKVLRSPHPDHPQRLVHELLAFARHDRNRVPPIPHEVFEDIPVVRAWLGVALAAGRRSRGRWASRRAGSGSSSRGSAAGSGPNRRCAASCFRRWSR